MIWRAIAGLALAAAIALTALRFGWLSRSGAAAAVVLGTVAVAAGWSWGALLIAFFFSSSLLSRVGAARKAERTAGRIEKGGARDAVQVAANGGLFGAAALLWLLAPWSGWLPAAAGALATATADTWATEIGTLATRAPRLITTWRRVPAGTSGAVSPRGLVATLAGAAFIALVCRLLRWPDAAVIGAMAGGVGGALADSLLGALWQERRRCAACAADTERRVHACGARTEHTGGWPWLNNDGVNLLSGVVGAAVALLGLA